MAQITECHILLAVPTGPQLDSGLDEAAATAIVWDRACFTTVSLNGSWDEEDTTDSCTGIYKASVPTKRNNEVSVEGFAKPLSTGAMPTWFVNLSDAEEARDVVLVSVFKGNISDVNVASPGSMSWMFAQIFNYSESGEAGKPCKFSFNFKVAGCLTTTLIAGRVALLTPNITPPAFTMAPEISPAIMGDADFDSIPSLQPAA